jgi:hypothetical protein
MYKLNAKLNQHRIEIQGQKPTKVKKQIHQPPKVGNVNAGAQPDNDLERE